MATAKPTTLHRHSLVVVLLSAVALIIVTLVGGGTAVAAVVGSRCPPRVPSMTAQQACGAVSGTRHMLDLCLRTLLAARLAAAPVVPVTRHAAAAVRGALDAYAATVAAATSLLDSGAVPADDERAAYGDCMVGYGSARVAMSRVAADLLRLGGGGGCDGGGCDGGDRDRDRELIKAGYTAGLRGMDGCTRGMLRYPASPLYARNLADRNMTLLAALLCSLLPAAPASSTTTTGRLE